MRRRENVSSATAVRLRGLIRIARWNAEASVSSSRRSAEGLPIICPLVPLASAAPRPLVPGVAVERTGRRELAEFVADHVLGHQDRDELVTVIDAEGQTDEL